MYFTTERGIACGETGNKYIASTERGVLASQISNLL